jgi:very-short-patch-repair endonuclease
MAATLACGPGAALSHGSAGALLGIGREAGSIEVTTPVASPRGRRGLIVHRRPHLGAGDLITRQNIPVTSPVRTLLDLATVLPAPALERAVNEADRLDLIDPEQLRAALDDHRGEPGVAILRTLLDRRTFVLTDSELERRFLRLVRRAELPPPRTREHVNGFRVDFVWPELGLVVETDGLRYHRTPAQQSRDRRRDQTHAAAGLTPLRFSHAQIRYEPAHVVATLRAVVLRLRGSG